MAHWWYSAPCRPCSCALKQLPARHLFSAQNYRRHGEHKDCVEVQARKSPWCSSSAAWTPISLSQWTGMILFFGAILLKNCIPLYVCYRNLWSKSHLYTTRIVTWLHRTILDRVCCETHVIEVHTCRKRRAIWILLSHAFFHVYSPSKPYPSRKKYIHSRLHAARNSPQRETAPTRGHENNLP